MIHASAILSPDAVVGDGGDIGPFAVLGVDGGGSALRIGAAPLIRSHTVIYRDTVIGDRFATGHGVLVREGTTIGDDVSIGSCSVIEHHVTVGNGVRLHSGCFVPELTVLEMGCWLGPGVVVTNARFPNRPDTKASLLGVIVERDAVVGAGVTLLPGVRIGAQSLVGAGAVVVDDVDAGTTVAGNPARRIR